MASVDVHLIVNTLLYFFIFACGFAISIPIGISQNEFKECLLYGTLEPYDKSTFNLSSGTKTNCDFPLYFGVFVCIVYAFGMGVFNLYVIYKSQKDPSITSKMWVKPFILINSLVTIVMITSSCIISVGFSEFCATLTQDKPYQYYKSCKYAPMKKNGIVFQLGHFYTQMEITQKASWICTLGWLALVISGIVRFKLNRRMKTRSSAASPKMTNINNIEQAA
uniref:Transmembrane protein 179 n=1 Tax=Magallana gigas TaxID=29159 RepID=A0A8W8ICG4_MAGGI|nr:transmembrane protein 179B-like [Crassostrea gigas]